MLIGPVVIMLLPQQISKRCSCPNRPNREKYPILYLYVYSHGRLQTFLIGGTGPEGRPLRVEDASSWKPLKAFLLSIGADAFARCLHFRAKHLSCPIGICNLIIRGNMIMLDTLISTRHSDFDSTNVMKWNY